MKPIRTVKTNNPNIFPIKRMSGLFSCVNRDRKRRRGSARAAKLRQTKKPGARIGSGRCLQTGPGKDAGVWRGRLNSGKRKSPERVSAPGTAREALTKWISAINASIELYKKESPERGLRAEALDRNKGLKKIPYIVCLADLNLQQNYSKA